MKPKFDPNKPFEAVDEKPKFDPSKPFEAVDPETATNELSFLQKAANVVDIPGAIVRSGVEAAISPEREILPSMEEQFRKTVASPTTASQYAPHGSDINKAFKKEVLGQENEPDTILNSVGGFVTEAALDPLQWFSWTSSPKKAIRKPITHASERQAAKAVSRYATMGDVTKEGVDIEAIGSRLVAEDLQGMLRKPVELYNKIAGKRHLQKLNPDSLDTLQLKRGEREGGLIGEVSQGITSAIKSVETQYNLKPQIPANIMGKQLLDKMKVALSKTSGETPDLAGIERTLEKALKPFERTKIPDMPIMGVTKTPHTLDLATDVVGKVKGGVDETANTLSLTDLHQLRKNIGKLVSDRAFYAAPDQAMRTETEALRDLYRELGSVIKTQLAGKTVNVGSKTVDAGHYYEAQNNRLKSFLDLESMLEFQPTKNLKDADVAALMAQAGTHAAIWGTAGATASMMGAPVNPLAAGTIGAVYGASRTASDAVKSNAPEYLTSIMKQAAKIAPAVPAAAKQGLIMGMRDGQFDPTMTEGLNIPEKQGYQFDTAKPAFQGQSPVGRKYQSLGSDEMTPMQVAQAKLPRTTEGLLQNKELVVKKLALAGVPEEMIDSVTQALNEDPDSVSSIAPLITMQFPTLFAKSKYNMFDGKILDPAERARAADATSKRDDIGSIERAKIISELNKSGKYLGE
jgi:hypothetical protein